MPIAGYNYVTLVADNGITVTALRGSDPPRLMSGFGGWEITDRPKRVAATSWKGRDPLRLALPLLFDGFIQESPVDTEIQQLELMAGADGKKPPVIKDIRGNVPRKDLDWVIESLEYGTNALFLSSSRLRQDVVVNLVQYVKDVRISEAVTKPGVPATYTTKKGDTLQKISNHFYGSTNQWHDIAQANAIRDPSHVKPGTVLQLP